MQGTGSQTDMFDDFRWIELFLSVSSAMFSAFGGSNPQVMGYCAMFLITGIITTMANQMLFYQGAGGAAAG